MHQNTAGDILLKAHLLAHPNAEAQCNNYVTPPVPAVRAASKSRLARF
jgi:hypothetical protein